jgi:hypothetical protein
MVLAIFRDEDDNSIYHQIYTESVINLLSDYMLETGKCPIKMFEGNNIRELKLNIILEPKK